MEAIVVSPDWDIDFYRKEMEMISSHISSLNNFLELSLMGDIPDLVMDGKRVKVEEINSFISRYCVHTGTDYTIKEPWTRGEIFVAIDYLSGMQRKMGEIVNQGPLLDIVCIMQDDA